MTGELNEFNSPGLARVRIAPLIAATIGVPYAMRLTQEVVLAGAVEWSETEFTEGTARYTERKVNENGDSYWECAIAMLRPKGEETWLQQLNEGHELRFIADITDHDGQRRLIGTRDEGLLFDISYDTKLWWGDRKEEAIVLTGRFRQRPPFYAPAGSGS